jgi:hypothetical protein
MPRELKAASSTAKPAIREPEIRPVAIRHAAAATLAESAAWATRVQQPKGIARVPTHTVGRARERRRYARARLALPIVLHRVAGQRGSSRRTLRTRDISSSGVFFLSPQEIDPGTPIELEVLLVNRPMGRGAVCMCAEAHVVRAEPAEEDGWFGLAVTFDDISYRRDDSDSSRRQTR